MGRPAKPVNVNAKHLTKEEEGVRREAEAALRGDSDNLYPPGWLSKRQKEVFDYVVSELLTGGLLGNVDVFILTQFAVAVERLEEIERAINDNTELLYDKALMTAKTKYTDDFKTGLRELSLSPQARAKLGGMALAQKQKEADPVLTLLQGKGKVSGA